MEELIKIAEEQINRLEEIQFTDVIDTNHTEISKEIRNWCEFIYKLKEKTAQEDKIQEQSSVIIDLDEDFVSEVISQINFINQQVTELKNKVPRIIVS